MAATEETDVMLCIVTLDIHISAVNWAKHQSPLGHELHLFS